MSREMSDDQLQVMSNFDVKLNILEAMERLLPEVPIRKLTVTKICKEADISHATFYRYFKDKFAVAQWHVRYTQMQGVDKIGRTLNWRDGYTITEQLMLEHPRFYEGASQSDDYNGIDAFSSRIRRKVLRDTPTMPQSANLPANRAYPDGIWRPHSKR